MGRKALLEAVGMTSRRKSILETPAMHLQSLQQLFKHSPITEIFIADFEPNPVLSDMLDLEPSESLSTWPEEMMRPVPGHARGTEWLGF